jgi:hypothetical protein
MDMVLVDTLRHHVAKSLLHSFTSRTNLLLHDAILISTVMCRHMFHMVDTGLVTSILASMHMAMLIHPSHMVTQLLGLLDMAMAILDQAMAMAFLPCWLPLMIPLLHLQQQLIDEDSF